MVKREAACRRPILIAMFVVMADGASRAGPLLGILQPALTAFLTWRATARSGIFQPADANPGSGITSAEIHLSTAHNLFKIDEPPLYSDARQVAKQLLGDQFNTSQIIVLRPSYFVSFTVKETILK